MKKRKNTLINIIIVLLLCVLLFSVWKLYGNSKDARESKEQFEQLENIIGTENLQEDETVTLTAGERYMSVYESNNHFAGWIRIENTPVNYPVVHTPADPEYYLRRDFSGKYSEYGVPFMDRRNLPDMDHNTIIYSHNMKNGTMFSAVESYTNKNFWLEHPYVEFDTMNGYGIYEVICVYRIDVDNTDFYFNQWLNFENEEDFNAYIAAAKALAPYDTGVTAGFGDKLLTLSTCEYTYENGRCVLLAKKIDSPQTKTFDARGNYIATTENTAE